MTVFTFSNTVLLRGVRARYSMRDSCPLKITVQPMIFTTPVRLNCFDFSVQKAFDMSLEGIENLLNIRLMFKEIDPAKT